MTEKGKSVYEKWEKAIKEVDLESMSILISKYSELPSQGIIHYRGNGTTFQTQPLNMVNQSLEACQLLVENGVDPNEYGDGDVLALHNASNEVSKYLISKGADVNKIGYEECTPLMYEVYMHNYENIKLLIENGADVNYQRNHDGYSSLHWAARKGDLEIVKMLLMHGANINSKDNSNRIPEELARANHHMDVYEYLRKEAT